MPNFENALLDFAKWIQILDDKGSLQWDWFGSPGDKVIDGMGGEATRGHMEALIQDLIDTAAVDLADFAGQRWVSFQVSQNGHISVGLAWNKSGDLRMGLAADSNFTIAAKQVDLALLVRMFKIDTANNKFASDLGNVSIGSHLPTPDFLQSISFGGEVVPQKTPTLALTVTETAQRSRTLAWDKNSSTRGWDCVRLALFVIEAWVHSKNGTSEFFTRLNKHLLPMFGEPPTNLTPQFPLFQDIGVQPDFKAWADSIINPADPANDAARVLTLLWHLRALITGKENVNFFKGSPVYLPLFPVAGETPPTGNPPTAQDLLATPRPPGAYVGIEDNYNGKRTVVLLLQDATHTAKIPLLSEGGTRVNVLAADAAALPQVSLPAGVPLKIQGQTITALQQILADPPAFAGTYSVVVNAISGSPVSYEIGLPTGSLPVPPQSPEAMMGLFVHWILNTAGAMAGAPVDGVIKALAPVFDKAFAGAPVDMKPVALAAVQAAAQNLTLKLGDSPLAVTLSWPVISATVTLSNLNMDNQAMNIRVGSLSAGAGLDFTNGTVNSASFAFHDLRLAQPAGGDPSGLAAKLLPDLTQAPGFNLTLSWDKQKNPPLSISGSAKIPVQKTIGPLSIGSIYISIDTTALDLGIDLSFELGPILISVHELGVRIAYQGPAIEPRLLGLGISLDADVVRISGMFGEVKKPNKPSDYVGGAVVTVLDLFQLSAIGGYSQTAKSDTSIFVFASLVAPLGGTPFFFITGIACGFGYNRTLPPPGLLYDHPFLKVMRGDLKLSGDLGADLAELSDYFAVADNIYWVAGGIQFVSFGFIYGKIVVAVQFGQRFALEILGSAHFAIEPIVSFEIDLEASADDEKFILLAGISPNSYLIHPDIFRLQGDFALGIWNDGDFVLSLGGFHPCFKVPDRYTQVFHTLNRIGVHATVFGFIHVSVECFFAVTNQALMAGASVSLWAEFAGISAGLDVYVDVLITWNPFFILARMGITVWFEFLGRHEIGVDLQVWTPDFGGTAHIEIFIVSFDIDFGGKLHNDPPTLAQFISGQLGVPAKGAHAASLARFNTADAAGLLRLDILDGRASKDKEQGKSSEQEGISKPIEVKAEFTVKLLSKLPLEAPSGPANQAFSGILRIPLCSRPPHGLPSQLNTILSITATNQSSQTVPIPDNRLEALSEQAYPAAEFGGPIVSAQADQDDARSQVASIDSEHPAVSLVPGMLIHWSAEEFPKNLDPQLSNEADRDESEGEERYPLPLGTVAGQISAGRVKSTIQLSKAKMVPVVRSKSVKPRPRILQATPRIAQRTGSFDRTVVAARLRGQTLAQLPANVPVIAVPASPPRSADLFGVSLHVTTPHAAAPIGRVRRVATPKLPLSRRRTVPRPQPATPTAATIAPGGAAHFRVDAAALKSVKLTATGNQIVRTVCLNEFEMPVADVYIPAAQGAGLPALTRRVICIGEGSAAPVSAGATPTSLESIGIEQDTSLLVVGGRTFAAHGCVMTSNALLWDKPDLLDTIPGRVVLRKSSLVSILFPGVRPNWTLAIIAGARVQQPESAASQVRWVAIDALLGNLRTVAATGHVAFLMTVDAPEPWTLKIELGPQWRLETIAVCDLPIADLAAQLRSTTEWDLVDDRFEQPSTGVSAGINLEVLA